MTTQVTALAAKNRFLKSPEKTQRKSTLFEKLFVNRLGSLKNGAIHLAAPGGHYLLGDGQADLQVQMHVNDSAFFQSVATGGSVGAAESYMAGEWHCSDLTALVCILVRNQDLLDGMEGGVATVAGWLLKAVHQLHKNNRSGSRRNIAAHYDIGNDLFELFLDKEWMMYSSALYHTGDESLAQAQELKLARLCDKLDLKPSDHLLEIGTGWGGAAIFAAQNYGCRVTTTTISEEQYKLAVERIAGAGLSDKITVLLEDYRDLDGQYDKLLSIEMVEAVGHQFLDGYFKQCQHLLKPDGLAAIQAITIEDHRYKQALNSVDFIKRYIFPGSFIPCVSVLTSSAAKAGLRLTNLEDIGPSYALTLQEWRERFMDQLDQVRELGYSEAFIRMWEFYLCYCEGGFRERSINDVHLLFAASGNRREQWVPEGS
ncbi:cyclopropane-fatty-acyl-phospholipid synthase family protein [Porticoccus sp. W117]|uniref:SAM-dependent methyltransferase n=1 Tax=Porticoccus sp. W117 TaxID=3054777 RepID=UPI002596969A|nr:cyclopropane-fatty-acyl-phospholipid synthase family protein [Porticoccus sp. W117]MDM3869965.1 cyclopropane-fatty-acyl-phospholipid synthase family protein [Porticoccus sp. W117]